jgi:hypothetical protein
VATALEVAGAGRPVRDVWGLASLRIVELWEFLVVLPCRLCSLRWEFSIFSQNE